MRRNTFFLLAVGVIVWFAATFAALSLGREAIFWLVALSGLGAFLASFFGPAFLLFVPVFLLFVFSYHQSDYFVWYLVLWIISSAGGFVAGWKSVAILKYRWNNPDDLD